MRKSKEVVANPRRAEMQALVIRKAAGSAAEMEIVQLLHNLSEI
jgi:hypothetical protein